VTTRNPAWRATRALLFNHLDACALTLAIAGLSLALNGWINVQSAFLLAALVLTAWLAFAFNDYCDAPHDALEPAKRERNFFALTRTPRTVLQFGFVALCGVAALGYLQYGERGAAVLAVALFGLWAYSAPPLRLKKRPIADLITHASFVQTLPYITPIFLMGAVPTMLDRLLIAVFFLSSLSAQLEQQARDYDVDRRTDGNFTTYFGRGLSVGLVRAVTVGIIALCVIGAVAGLIPPVVYPLGLIGAPLAIHRIVRRATQPRSEWLVRIAAVAAALYIGGIAVSLMW
jgi:4-hydroxybenzoate polyprenyltransferase